MADCLGRGDLLWLSIRLPSQSHLQEESVAQLRFRRSQSQHGIRDADCAATWRGHRVVTSHEKFHFFLSGLL